MFRLFQLILLNNSYLDFPRSHLLIINVLKRIQFCLFWSLEFQFQSVAKSMFSFKFKFLEDRKLSACYHSLKLRKKEPSEFSLWRKWQKTFFLY